MLTSHYSLPKTTAESS